MRFGGAGGGIFTKPETGGGIASDRRTLAPNPTLRPEDAHSQPTKRSSAGPSMKNSSTA